MCSNPGGERFGPDRTVGAALLISRRRGGNARRGVVLRRLAAVHPADP
jgi:hypothetical protein